MLYGRRRVGKTALVAEFLRNKQAIYFLATEENETQNRTTFKNIVAEQIGDRQLMNTDVDHWDKIFKIWDELEQKADKVDWKKSERRNHFIIFSISGFSDDLKKLAETRDDLILMS